MVGFEFLPVVVASQVGYLLLVGLLVLRVCCSHCGAKRIDGGFADVGYGVVCVEQLPFGLHRVGLGAQFIGFGHGVGVFEQCAERFLCRLVLVS